jgi:mRNA interferase MazF
MRGEVWVANFNPGRGQETGKIRPALVIQDDGLTAAHSPLVVVLPLSTLVGDTPPGPGSPFILLPARDRLRLPSLILADQPRTLDRRRLGEGPLTRLLPEELAAVEQALKLVLGLG